MAGVAGFQLSLRYSLEPAPLPQDGVQFSVIAKGPVLHDWWHYSYTHDSIERPTTMTGEGLTLVDNISYNAAGAMTAFRRRESASVTVDNTYTFNNLYQLKNQTVVKGSTTLQNLTYTFSATQNNGQILSQTDALSGETVEYEYDSLNRLTSAETAGSGGWGLSYSYDGFGNRTNQSVTKGSGPTHSVTINAANNRISTSGYVYDSNGNMTQMPSLTMTYDIANRMVTSNHASAGNHVYGYNQANQRVFERKGTAVTYYLYGLGGERLMAMTETCSGSCTAYTENERWIYFAGKKMFAKTPSTLKAVTPNRLESEAKHYPYGEVQGTAPTDTKDYFATYRRDETGLDYAWNRYYSPTMGRFTAPDPYRGSVNPLSPNTWNRYAYASSDPINRIDVNGLTDYQVDDVSEFDPKDPRNVESGSGSITVYGDASGSSGDWVSHDWPVCIQPMEWDQMGLFEQSVYLDCMSSMNSRPTGYQPDYPTNTSNVSGISALPYTPGQYNHCLKTRREEIELDYQKFMKSESYGYLQTMANNLATSMASGVLAAYASSRLGWPVAAVGFGSWQITFHYANIISAVDFAYRRHDYEENIYRKKLNEIDEYCNHMLQWGMDSEY